MGKILRGLIYAFACFYLLLCPLATRAQSTNGTILGNVKDASGSEVPEARVTIANLQTGIANTFKTDSHGDYEAPNLLPGRYRVLVEMKGFETSVQTGFILDPRAILRVDVTLSVGAVQSTVEVTGTTPAISTETGTVAEQLTAREIKDLPINSRGVFTGGSYWLVSTLPGVQSDPGYGYSIAGSHQSMNEISVDGFSIVNIRFNNPISEELPSAETLSEINVTSQLGTAENGQVADVSFTSHGGTNDYHGGLFEYFQNDALDATPLFAPSKATKRANDFGGSLGGPVRLPYYSGKDRTFFFFDWESNRFHTSNFISQGVPTPDMRIGNFGALCSSYSGNGVCNSPTGTQLKNPFTGQPYPFNVIPQSEINSVSQRALNTFYPLPNFNSGDIASNFREVLPAPSNSDQFDLRIDQKLTSKQFLWGRFSWRDGNILSPLGLLQGDQATINDTKSFGLTYTYAIKTNLFNEARFGFNKQLYSIAFPAFPNGQNVVSQLGLNLPGPFQAGSAIPGFIFQQSTISSTANNRQEDRSQHRFQFDDNVTWIHGRHSMKFGTDIRANQFADYVDFTGADNFGVFQFSGAFTGFDFADFLLGLPGQSLIANAGPNFNASEKAYAVFAQDQFQVTPKLTVTYGVRYEVHPPFWDKTLQFTNFNPANGDVIVPNAASLKLAAPGFLASINACPGYSGATTPCTPVLTAQQAGLPERLRYTDYTKVLPRLGFAYRLTDRWVVRGGAGMYDMTTLGNIFYNMVGIHTADVRFYANSATNGAPAFQFPSVSEPGIGIVGVPGTANFFTATGFDTHDPYAEQWSLTVERELARDTGLRVSYTGMRTIGLLVNENLNQQQPHNGPYNPALNPYPNWDLVYSGVNGGESFFNSLEVVLTHRVSHGLTAQSSYVLSKNLSNADGSAGSTNAYYTLENGPFIMNRFGLASDYGNVNFTRRQRWLSTYVYQFPYGRGERFGSNLRPALEAILGNWQTSGTLIVQTGPFLTPYYNGGTDPSGTGGNFNYPGQRPDRVCNGSVPNSSASNYFNSSCFPVPATGIGRFGNSGVGILTGPGTVVWDAGLFKVFPITEKLRLRFEATFTNVLNHANLGIPDLNVLAGSDFGVIHGSQSPEGSANRTGQLGLRLDY